ncbi:MAG: 50S ribosomal protein L13 [Candidatus Portnoybacteria bacterium CG06_land_8_20_14_3_00_39_12]|uniref:Large ribosomal subunit protein uL13 n=3 Tax=Candidatus Portnoyibacteriota TaxID=1817913 RepID=A0A2M8KFR2_9BACT|nr:MAG: 50S ribosomal protein L13 [Parcubacteria group bacterium CG1_02_40_25]PIU75519.1 MAG: 50S ribosomal protein L13 [Candidatus Portnoybacteria bacterium CG06_land_8_20_14_3_00_39_12]PIZ70775.1 MAG: 50S ribosomal protein L13 [Candidatus Portnoybacteria bacterium CG_4_10_14_0_2_um_filter_39_11]PJE58776.1 MAG: 50S ribosomal protein L13 [Candidatus Portnoybacteria bacterium CG10_big_fil_rev_8_21_14_0_10_40_22]
MSETKPQIIDAKNQILGRLATKIAVILRGKDRVDFQPHILFRNKVVVINTDKVKVTAKKLDQKKYQGHSGYSGGFKEKTLRELMEQDSRQAVRKAVFGMLPVNKLRAKMLNNLKLYHGEKTI